MWQSMWRCALQIVASKVWSIGSWASKRRQEDKWSGQWSTDSQALSHNKCTVLDGRRSYLTPDSKTVPVSWVSQTWSPYPRGHEGFGLSFTSENRRNTGSSSEQWVLPCNVTDETKSCSVKKEMRKKVFSSCFRSSERLELKLLEQAYICFPKVVFLSSYINLAFQGARLESS